MSRQCALTQKKHQTGNKVSHAQNKSKRRFKVNLQNVTLRSQALGLSFQLRIAVSTLRSIDHNGGLDAYLLKTSNLKLSPEAIKIKKQVQKAQGSDKAAA